MTQVDDTPCRARRTKQMKPRTDIPRPASQIPAYKAFFRADPIDRINMIKDGILASDAKRILSGLAVTRAVAMSALNISVASINRRVKGKNRLPPAESERVLGVAFLVGQIEHIVKESGNPQDFEASAWMSRWLCEPLPAMGGVRPLDLLATMEGQALVSNTLAHIQGGAYA